ncbi:type IV pilus modification protein PilV [uncultured Gilvimarinus sp.]|uniref:type IV pilus modification protein PilV n=1 Tax=uncultured Gilvimarinus sp. TaxID=1689143 RepID=UPI0030D927DA
MDSNKQSGISLIEVMITVLILSTAILALAALHTRSLQYNTSAYMRSQANIMAYDVIDRIRAQSAHDVISVPAENELKLIVANLPGASIDIDCDDRLCTVSVKWDEPTVNEAGNAAEQTTFSYVSQV